MFGLNSQSEEICFTTNSKAGISGLRDLHPANDLIDSSGENEEDPTRRLLAKSQMSVRELAQFVGKAAQQLLYEPSQQHPFITEHCNS